MSKRKRPLGESLEENAVEPGAKRTRLENLVLLRANRRSRGRRNGRLSESANRSSELANGGSIASSSRTGKRKTPTNEDTSVTSAPTLSSVVEADENDIISELTKEFKKARLRPVFFTFSTFIEQTVDEVGFTMADEPETEVTVRLNLPRNPQANMEESGNKVTDLSKTTNASVSFVPTLVEPAAKSSNFGGESANSFNEDDSTSAQFVFVFQAGGGGDSKSNVIRNETA